MPGRWSTTLSLTLTALLALVAVGCVEVLECDGNNPCPSRRVCFRGFCKANCGLDPACEGPEGCSLLNECRRSTSACRPCDNNCIDTEVETRVCAPCDCTPRCQEGELCVDGACHTLRADPGGTDLLCVIPSEGETAFNSLCFRLKDGSACAGECLQPDGSCCDPEADSICINGACQDVTRLADDPTMVCVDRVCFSDPEVRLCNGVAIPL